MATIFQFSTLVGAVWYVGKIAFDDSEERGHVPYPHRQYSTTGAWGHHLQDANADENAFGVDPVVENRRNPIVGDAQPDQLAVELLKSQDNSSLVRAV
jgi:hypothetical protein